jgi:hypothetical protein
MYDTGFVTSLAGAFWFVYLASAVVLGIVVGLIGREKGRSGWNWFWAGLFLSLIGLIAVCAVPRLEKRARVSQLGIGMRLLFGRWPVIVVTVVVLVSVAWFGLSWAVRDHAGTPVKVALTSSTTTPAATAVWREVARWSGNGMKQTETFSIRSSEWRISWKTMDDSTTMREDFPDMSGAAIYVYSDAGALVSLVTATGVGSDVSYVHAQPGRFYLEISALGVDWEVVVEERY